MISVRLEASGDTPDDVLRYWDEAVRRLGLGQGDGPYAHGATELVIEGNGDGGYKGRIKINYGPMNSADEGVWFEGGEPYGADAEKVERLRRDMNIAELASDDPQAASERFAAERGEYEKALRSVIVVVGGQQHAMKLSPSATPNQVKKAALVKGGHQNESPAGWNLTDSDGNPIVTAVEDYTGLGDYPPTLFLSPLAGFNG